MESEKKCYTGGMIERKGGRGFTACIHEFPDTVVDGKTISETYYNLIDKFEEVLEVKGLKRLNNSESVVRMIEESINFEIVWSEYVERL